MTLLVSQVITNDSEEHAASFFRVGAGSRSRVAIHVILHGLLLFPM